MKELINWVYVNIFLVGAIMILIIAPNFVSERDTIGGALMFLGIYILEIRGILNYRLRR